MKLVLILSLFLYFVPAYSRQGGDGDHVGNGGGFAEMFTLSADRITPALLVSCIKHAAQCGLPEGGPDLLLKLIADLPRLQKTPLTFSPSCGTNFRIGPEKIEIPSCILYAGEKSLPESDLLLIALQARVLQGGYPGMIVDWLKEPARRTQKESSSRALSLASGELKIYYFRFENWMFGLGQFVFLETPKGSHDLSSILEEKLNCDFGDLSYQIALESHQQLAPESGLFQGRVYWNCGRRKFQANLRVFASLEDSDLAPESLSVQILRKEEVW